jgi:RNA polymerase-binding transcription factor DksA
MTNRLLERYRDELRILADRIGGAAESLEEEARSTTGGDAGGNLSNAPMHLGDLGSATYTQELSATLLENETFLRAEINAALARIDRGAYGFCERCGQAVAEERLEAVPYTRFCAPCAEVVGSGLQVNMNEGRPVDWSGSMLTHDQRAETGRPARGAGGRAPFTDLEKDVEPDSGNSDRHATGTAGGGTAVGGLAGTNVGRGDPDEAALEEAMGSSEFDVEIEGDDAPTEAYSGPAGGAVGGTPANKRARGGKTGGGLSPRPGRGDSPTGQ